MEPRFEFIPCTCPDAVLKKHGHIYDKKNKTNSSHIYDESAGLRFMESLPVGEITEENIEVLISDMNKFFS